MFGFITTYRDRERHKAEFIKYYGKAYPETPIIIVEQADTKPFNRGALMNVGVHYAKELTYFDLCDIDMIEEKHFNYPLPQLPVLLASQASQFNYQMPYPEYFSGHVLMTRKHYELINGYPNTFWGWGGEDDELRRRVMDKIGEYAIVEKRYKSLSHTRKIDEKLRRQNVERLKADIDYTDGLSSIKFVLLTVSKFKNITHLKVAFL
jgi:predicted glycosyltransferase involved in capsule biosynthesis